MKGKTRRKIKRFLGIPSLIVGAVFTVGGFVAPVLQHLLVGFIHRLSQSLVKPIAPSLQAFPDWVGSIAYWMILAFTSWALCRIYSKSLLHEIRYFEEIKFGKPDKNTILKAIDGILNTEKVAPFYVHAAPKCKEVETIKLRLKKTGFAMVSGGPGEGKSMAAYHAAYEFQNEARYRVYELRTERLENKTGKEILDEVLFQLDSLKGKRKLIIVDDAHKLAIKQDLNEILQQEAKEGNGKYIWVETELYEGDKEGIQSDTHIQIDFQSFLSDLQREFYESEAPILKEALRGRIEGLEDAKKRANKGAIRDAWHFAFVASRGEERLKQEITYLNGLETLVLFLISAYTVLSGESELSINYLLNKLDNLKFGWLTEALRKLTFTDAIKSLQEHKYEPKRNYERRSMIRIYDKSKSDRGYIASLHYNFARAVIRASLLRRNLVRDLLSSVKELLTSDYRKCAYFWVFHRDLGEHAAEFDRENKDWLVEFISNPLPELKYYPPLLRGIKNVAKDIYNEIIRNLDIARIAKEVSNAEVGQFDQLAQLLNAIGDRRDELIKNLDLKQLSRTANGAEVWQFDQLAQLLNAIGDRRDELIKNLDLKQLSRTANGAEVGQFQQIAYLLNAIGDRRDELIKNLDLKRLGTQANKAKIEHFVQIASLLIALGDNRNKLIEQMDLETFAKTASDAKIEQFNNLAQLLRELKERRDELVKELNFEKLAKAANAAEINEFEQIAKLLKELGQRKSLLSMQLDHDTLVQKANQAGPHDIMGLTMLIAELEEEDRSKFIQKVNWDSICIKCPIHVPLLRALGASLENLWKQAKNLSNKASVEKVAQHLRAHADEIKQEIAKANPKQYSGVAKFLWNCNQVDPGLAKEIATETMGKLAETFRISPTEYQGTGQLINALYAIDPDLSASFVKNNRVRGRIQQSINEHDWSKEVEGLKHLIRALYRSVPELWKKMVSYKWLTVDLDPLDLDSIYRDVDEKRNASTAYKTA